MSVRDEIKSQIKGALKDADFPIRTPEELLAAMPEGADTKCKAGDVELTAGEAGKKLSEDDFPFESAEDVAETLANAAGL